MVYLRKKKLPKQIEDERKRDALVLAELIYDIYQESKRKYKPEVAKFLTPDYFFAFFSSKMRKSSSNS